MRCRRARLPWRRLVPLIRPRDRRIGAGRPGPSAIIGACRRSSTRPRRLCRLRRKSSSGSAADSTARLGAWARAAISASSLDRSRCGWRSRRAGRSRASSTPIRSSRWTSAAEPVGAAVARVSAEALLHVEIVRARGPAPCCTHTRSGARSSPTGTATRAALAIEGYEMLKGLEGVRTHEHREWLPIVENDQDMPRLAGVVRDALDAHPAAHGVPAAPSRAVHLGRRLAAGRPSRRDSRVPVGSDGRS